MGLKVNLDILIVVTTETSGPYLKPLIAAAQRANATTGVFLTNDGVKLGAAKALGAHLTELETAVVCAESWTKFVPDEPTMLTSGSQTNHSQLIGSADVVISL